MSHDPLRTTLDQLALDPDAGADRHYLETVLRRLGYSEAEIRKVLGAPGEAGRVIEVEYSGGDRKAFLIGKEGGFSRGAPSAEGVTGIQFSETKAPAKFRIADDPEAGVEEFENVDLEDVDVSDDWDDDWGEDKTTGFDVDNEETGGFSVTDEEEGEFIETPSFFERKPAIPVGWGVVEDEPEATWEPAEEPAQETWDAPQGAWVEESDDAWGPIDEAPGGAWMPEDGEALEWAPAEEPEAEWAPAEEAQAEWAPATDAYQYGDYTLYARDVDLSTGRSQRIYFFAKGEPKSGEPSPMPEGYEVGVSEKTGLPFLRKTHTGESVQCGALTNQGKQCRLTAQDDSDYCHLHQDYEPPEGVFTADMDTEPLRSGVVDTPPRRIRVARIRAADREAAEAELRRQGRDVRGSVPFGIETHEDEA